MRADSTFTQVQAVERGKDKVLAVITDKARALGANYVVNFEATIDTTDMEIWSAVGSAVLMKPLEWFYRTERG